MEDLWKVALGVAGLGALACFVFWSLYRQWLKLPIWTQMTRRHQFIVIIVFLGLTFSFAVLALGVYAYQQHDRLTQTKSALAIIYSARKQQLELLLADQVRILMTANDAEGLELTKETQAKALALSDQRIQAVIDGDVVAADQYSLQLRDVLASYDLLIGPHLKAQTAASGGKLPLSWLEFENNQVKINKVAVQPMGEDRRI